jgi:Cof subfamily protein (haloacid dehalogenase superfamily)
MNLSKIKLAVFDVDGTILNDFHTLEDNVAASIRSIKNKGVTVALATGRSLYTVQMVREKIDLKMPLILLNWGWVHDSALGEDWLKLNLDKNVAQRAIRYLREWGFEYIVQKGIPEAHIFYYDTMDENNRERAERIGRNEVRCRRVPDIMSILNEDCGEITVLDADARIAECRNRLAETGLQCRLTYSTSPFSKGFSWLEILHPNAEKGYALKFLAGKLGILREEIMAVGDNYNDLEMLKWAGIGVAVGNAVPEVKETADIVLTGNSDGICKLAEMFG